jgi:cell division protein ZapA (FtsZ GTPase activity inhibitor)
MSNKEILDLKIMGKNISIACPPKDKKGLIQAAEILNNQIESIPDKSNALILASLDLAFKSQIPQESEDTNAISKKVEESLKVLISQIEQSIK